MSKKIVVAGATANFLEKVVYPILARRQDCLFIIITDEELESGDRVEVVCCEKEKLATRAIEAIKEDVDNTILMKGQVQTAELLKEVLRTDNNLKTDKLLSQITRVELDNGRKFLLTDGALNISPDVKAKVQITENALAVACALGINMPKVALLSSIEVYNPKMPSSKDAKEVCDYFISEKRGIIEGPISMDVAMDKSCAETKGYNGKIMGDADVLVVPNIDAGNILYKTLARLMKAKMSGIVAGAKIPIVLTSRGDSYETKINSLDFALSILKK